MWSPIILSLDCGKLQTFQVYVAQNPDALVQRYHNREQAWCSLSSLFQPGCQLLMSPFTTNYVGVRKIINTGTPCRFSTDSQLSNWMMISCVLGVLVFLLAGPLSESMALRITSGGLLFALGSVVILAVVIGRQMPGRRSMATSAMLLGSSSWAVLRWLTGHWLPSWYALLHNRWLLAYLSAAGLLGGALTYLYGGTENAKLNTLMRVGLQLLGLLLLYCGTWTAPPVFATLVGVALALRLARAVAPLVARFGGRRPTAQPGAEGAAEEQPPATPLGAGRSPSPRVVQLQPHAYYSANGGSVGFGNGASPLPLTPVHPHYLPVPAPEPMGSAAQPLEVVSPLVRAGLIINPLSGRGIKIGGDVYNRLVEQGYTPDMAAGRLQAPPLTPGSPNSPEGFGPGSSSVARRRKQRSRLV